MLNLPARLQHELHGSLAPNTGMHGHEPLRNIESAHRDSERMRSRDEQLIESAFDFMRTLIVKNVAGHTIFGGKPLSTVWLKSDGDEHSGDNPTMSQWVHFQTLLVRAGLVSSNYVARLTGGGLQNSSDRELLIYNRSAVRSVFERNRELFEERLGKGYTADRLLDDLDRTSSLNSAANGDVELRGLLLGYSRGACAAFARRAHLGAVIGLADTGDKKEFERLCLQTPGINEDAKAEFASLSARLQHAHRLFLPPDLAEAADSVRFKTFADDAEARELFRGYRANQEFFRELHEDRSYLYTALARWGGMA